MKKLTSFLISSFLFLNIYGQLNTDVQLVEVSIPEYGLAGNLTISGTLQNIGLDTITSLDIAWDNGGPINNETFSSLNLYPGYTFNFSHNTPYMVNVGTCDSLNITLILPGDQDLNNNSMTVSHCGISMIPQKKVVGEMRSGTWCGWCPRGMVGLSEMEAYPNFISIDIHNADPMAVPAYDSDINPYIMASFPNGAIDRLEEGDPRIDFPTLYADRVNKVVPCDIKNIVARYDSPFTTLYVSTDSEWYGDIDGDFRLSCVIIENDVIPSGNLAQENFYAGGSNGPMAFPIGINNSYDFGAVSAPNFVLPIAWNGFDYTARSLSSNTVLGDIGSLPSVTVTMGVYSYTFNNLPSNTVSDPTKAVAIVMVINSVTGEIVNAESSVFTILESTNDIDGQLSNLSLYPNPTNSLTNVSFTLAEPSQVTLQVFNSVGKLVYDAGSKTMHQGNQHIPINGNELPNGIYFVNLSINDNTITKRLSLIK